MNVNFNKFLVKLKQPVVKDDIKKIIIFILIFIGASFVASFFFGWIALKIGIELNSLFILVSAYFLGSIIKERYFQYNIWNLIITLVGFFYVVSFFLNSYDLWVSELILLSHKYFDVSFFFNQFFKCFYNVPILVRYYVMPFFSVVTYIYVENLVNFFFRIVVIISAITMIVKQVFPKNPLLLLDYNQNLLDHTEYGRKLKDSRNSEDEEIKKEDKQESEDDIENKKD